MWDSKFIVEKFNPVVKDQPFVFSESAKRDLILLQAKLRSTESVDTQAELIRGFYLEYEDVRDAMVWESRV